MTSTHSDLFDSPRAVLLYDELAEYEEAIAALTEHLKSNPTNGFAYNNRAVAHYEIGERQKAAGDFALAIEHAGPHPAILKNWGFLLKDEGKIDDAIDRFRQATRQSPEDATLHRCLALALMTAHRPEDAIISFSEAIRIEPLFPRTYLDRAAAYAARGATVRAVRDRFMARVLQLIGEPQRTWRKPPDLTG